MSRSKFKGQGYQGQISCSLKIHCSVLAANNIVQQQTGPFHCCRGGGNGSAQHGCVRLAVRFMSDKTSLALVISYFYCSGYRDVRFGDCVGDTAENGTSIFSPVQMH